jgi:hypothetical protein
MSMAVPDGHRALGEGTVADHLAGLDQGSRAEGVTSEPSARYTRLMVALDTLAYVRHLESAGVPRAQAEAHAEAVASFAGDTLATKRDLLRSRRGCARRSASWIAASAGGLTSRTLASAAGWTSSRRAWSRLRPGSTRVWSNLKVG